VGDAAEYGGELRLASGYTNNLTLAPDDSPIPAKTQWINSVMPRVYLTHIAPAYEVDIDYELQALFYAGESELNEAFSQLWATGLLDLVGDELVLRGFARATQVNINPEDRVIDNNVNITGNRSDAFAWEVGPRWRRLLFGTSDLDAYYYVGRIEYKEDNLDDVDTQEGRVSLGSTQVEAKSFSYQLNYRYRRFDYETTGPAKWQRAQAELGYFTSPSFQLVGIAGMESSIARNDGKLDEPYWEAGFRSWFGKNMAEAFYGRRFYGPTYRLTWNRSMPRSELRLTYREIQQTTEAGALDDIANDADEELDPVEDPSLAPQSGIERPGTGDRSLARRLRGDYRWSLFRTDLRLFVFWLEREQITPGVSVPGMIPADDFSKDESFGGGFDASWRVGVKTDVSLFGSWRKRTFDVQLPDGGRRSDLYRGDFRVRYDLSLSTDLIAQVGYHEQAHSTSDFSEWHAFLELKWYFWGR